VNLALTRLYGRALPHERINDYVPDARFAKQSILAAVRLNGDIAPLMFEGTLNGEIFVQYTKQFLAPLLKKGDLVVMDNASPHKVSGVAEAIEACGAKVLYLPQYSPDLNPTELLWSKVKAFLKKEKARTQDSLENAVKRALDSVTIDDIVSWFEHCGYY